MNPLRKIRRSLSLRLVLLAIVTAFVLMVIVNMTITRLIAEGARTQLQPHMERYLDYLSEEVGNNPERAGALEQELPIEISSYPPGTAVDMTAQERRGPFRIHERILPDGTRLHFRMARAEPQREHRGAFLLGLASILLVLIIAWLIAARMLRPLRMIQRDVQIIGGGVLDHRIDYKRNNEFGDLASTINSMTGEIQRMLEAKRELLLAISHELRSPVTRAKVSLALLDESRAKANLEHDLDEVESIINELLESERLNQKHAVLHREPVNINELVRQVVEENRMEGQVRLELADGIPDAELDPVRIRLLLKNLASNAIRYSGSSQRLPVISTAFSDNRLEVVVSDSGPGIPKEYLDHVFEPFYRADPSRHRRSGGYGLGLYLCKLIVEAHGGTILINSQQNRGTTLSVYLQIH